MGAKEYLRTFWWMVAVVPAFGVAALLFGNGILQAIGLMAILWPISIPARSVVSTAKASRLFSSGVRMVLFEDRIEFQGQTPGPNGKPLRMTLPLGNVRDVVRRGDWLLVRTMRLEFDPVSASAFESDTDREAFLHRIEEVRNERAAELRGG